MAEFVITPVFAALLVVLFLAFAFDFMNGFHDAANAIATVVATRVLSPIKAVALAAFGNFIAFAIFPLAVAQTLAKGIVDQEMLLPAGPGGLTLERAMLAVACGLVGALIWDVITWLLGLPTSSSHALIGGMLGGAVMAVGPAGVIAPDLALVSKFFFLTGVGALLGASLGTVFVVAIGSPRKVSGILKSALAGFVIATVVVSLVGAAVQFGVDVGPLAPIAAKPSGLFAVLLFMVVSPILGLGLGFFFVSGLMRACRRWAPTRVNRVFGRLQLVSAGFFAVAHGGNDAQKTMGIVLLLLVVTGHASAGSDAYPLWVVLGAYGAIGLGTLLGGWRIVKTMAKRIAKLKPYQGFSAETAGGGVPPGLAVGGIPVSTTHAIASSIMGVGAAKGRFGVRWQLARTIVWAWFLTIPASMGMAMLAFWIGDLFVA